MTETKQSTTTQEERTYPASVVHNLATSQAGPRRWRRSETLPFCQRVVADMVKSIGSYAGSCAARRGDLTGKVKVTAQDVQEAIAALRVPLDHMEQGASPKLPNSYVKQDIANATQPHAPPGAKVWVEKEAIALTSLAAEAWLAHWGAESAKNAVNDGASAMVTTTHLSWASPTPGELAQQASQAAGGVEAEADMGEAPQEEEKGTPVGANGVVPRPASANYTYNSLKARREQSVRAFLMQLAKDIPKMKKEDIEKEVKKFLFNQFNVRVM